MFKNLKKHSKLLVLGLIFSTLLPLSSFAIEPQKPNDIDIVQAIKNRKRKREEKVSKVLSDEYIIDEMIPDFVVESDDRNQWPRCEMPVYFRLGDDRLFGSSHPSAGQCNRPVKNFFLIPDHDQNMHIIGYECIKHFGINGPLDLDKNLPKKLHIPNPQEAQKSKNQRDLFIATKILKYFYDQRNWNNRCKHENIYGKDVALANSYGNFVLDIAGLKGELEKYGYVPPKEINSLSLTLWHRKGTLSFKFYYDDWASDEITSRSPFESNVPLSDDKIFEAFKFFCKVHDIYQPFSLKK